MVAVWLWNFSYALHTISVPTCCGIFVYKLETSIDTKIVSWPIFVFSMKLIKSVVSSTVAAIVVSSTETTCVTADHVGPDKFPIYRAIIFHIYRAIIFHLSRDNFSFIAR